MKGLKNILRSFQEAMASATFAEAGEFDTALQMIHPGKNANKKVLLGAEGREFNPKVFRYALDLCHRLGGSLEILQVISEPAEGNVADTDKPGEVELPDSFRKTLQNMGILYRIILAKDIFEKEVVRYADNRRDLLCVVLGERPLSGEAHIRRKRSALFKGLSCPVVFYGEAVQV